MNRNAVVWIVLIMLVLASLAVYSTYFSQVRSFPEQRSSEVEQLECWVYNKTWEPFLSQFQNEHPQVDVKVRVFRSYEDLYDELLTSLSANTAPDLVELNSSYGVAELAQMGALQPKSVYMAAAVEAASDEIDPSFSTSFSYKGKEWAVPIGVSVPVLFYNRDLVNRMGSAQQLAFNSLADLGSTIEEWTAAGSKDWQQELAMDKDLPSLFLNLWLGARGETRTERLSELLHMWKGLVYDSKVMKPLQHNLAASDFITGKTLFYAAGSENVEWFDRYIAGKFAYGLLPLPGTTNHKFVPKLTAFAVLAGEYKSKHAAQMIQFLIAKDNQKKMLGLTGYLPVLQSVLEELRKDAALPDKYNQLLAKPLSFANWQPSSQDRPRARMISDILGRIEGDPAAEESEAIEQLLPYMP
ncbi:sugar ABC transporter substrate-binding protein [Paenibacillus marchantiophytorum]|uniref:Sugar ABC transporter substrate-binding protein n=1 Tax=Paenibacillus marchantiophytorum TaxID=1619310 RepID=A0ABQ1EVQ2_9BACL|nr:extracellular solute-binding protein [Paenibacillus marchantiophytorum]GFZ88668.1 sugar ABC transporter substrate-binding protein [Paenibacillus marchantiophytorum]